MRKLSYEFIKSEFEKRGYTLISKEYINARTKLKFICDKHGEQEITYDSLKHGQGCKQCGYETRANAIRTSYNDVKSLFESRGYTLISKEYKNALSALEFICPKHGLQTITYASLYMGRGCKECGIEKRAKTKTLPYDDVKAAFEECGYTLVDTKYTKAKKPLRYICPIHGLQKISYSNLKNGERCRKCVAEDLSIRYSGSGGPGWKEGISEVNKYLRDKINSWVQDTIKSSDYTCCITGVRGGKLAVHHQYSFNKIVSDTLCQLSLPIHETIGAYTDEEIKLLTDTFIANNNSYPYAVLSNKTHRLYHNLYGNDNTPEQFKEFTQRYHSGEFVEQLKEIS